MAARSGRNVLEMLYWYNMALMEGVPCSGIYKYKWKPQTVVLEEEDEDCGTPFIMGQKVYVKPRYLGR
jgi:hypothetical protein